MMVTCVIQGQILAASGGEDPLTLEFQPIEGIATYGKLRAACALLRANSCPIPHNLN